MFKNAFAYSISGLQLQGLEEAVARRSLNACSTIQLESKGWTPPGTEGQELVYVHNGHLLLSYGTEKRLLPDSTVNNELKKQMKYLEDQGEIVGRKQKIELKLNIVQQLLSKSHVVYKHTMLWIDTNSGMLFIDTTSVTLADSIVSLLIQTFPEISIRIATPDDGVSSLLTNWVLQGDIPSCFSIGRDCELTGTGVGNENSTIRYTRHSLDDENDGIRFHLAEGKSVTSLSLTWNSRLSFSVDSSMQFKRIALLDIAKEEQTEESDDSVDTVATEFILFTGEFSAMWEDWAQIIEKASENASNE